VARFTRSLWLTVALAVLLLAVGGWLLYLPTRAALEHMEAFEFRRMLVARLGETNTFRFFFATNRRLEPGDAPLEERFGKEREERLQFGFFDTEVKPVIGLGMLINPTQWLQDEEIRIEKVQPLDSGEFVATLRPLVDSSSRRSLLIVVHGFREAFTSGLRKTAFLSHVLDINSPVMVFDWPGNQGASPLGYRRARRVADESAAQLAETLKLVIRDVKPDKLWLLANSMGAQVVARAFSTLYEDPDFADPEKEIDVVVLTAPDVDHKEFDQQFKHEITALARNLTVYVSSNDRALLMSRILNRSSRRGESTLGDLSPDQFAEAASIADLVEPDSQLVTLVDVTPVNRTRNFHNFSLETPEFFDDLYLRLGNDEIPRSRLQYQVRGADGSLYWVLTSGR
jgi:esterase/lipase superfamily enzyme